MVRNAGLFYGCVVRKGSENRFRASGKYNKRIAMSDANHLRKWAAQVARQAGEEPDAAEAQRLLNIAEYWLRLADGEESNQPAADLGVTDAPSS
jgi:hypothetical protein